MDVATIDLKKSIKDRVSNNYEIDCLLINPAHPPATYPPLGLCYLSAVLLRHNIKSKIIDRPSTGMNIDEIVDYIVKTKPPIVGITVMTSLLPETYELISKIKNLSFNTEIVVGGPYITVDPEIVLEMGIKYGFRGDAELVFPDFCKSLLNSEIPDINIPGIIVNLNGTIHKEPVAVHPNLDELPIPAYELLNIRKFRSTDINLRTISMIISRGGCPYTCTFCGNLMKEKYRRISTQKIIEQIKLFQKKWDIELIEFVDETFTLNKVKTVELCNAIIENGIKIKWICLTRVDNVDEELLVLMKKAGCYKIRFGVESGIEKLRYAANKKIPDARFFQIINACKSIGIKTLCFYILGHPNETYSEMKQSIDFSLNLGSDTIAYSRMEPIPNSEIFRMAVNEGKIKPSIWRDFMKGNCPSPIYYPDSISKKQMDKLFKLAFLRYYTHPKTIKYFLPLMLTLGFWNKAFSFIKAIFYEDKNLP